MAKFHFIVPVLSRVMAPNRWTRAEAGDASVEATLERCLRSLMNQRCRDVAIHVVVHEQPLLPVDVMEAIQVHAVTFPRPPDISLDEYNALSGKVLPELPPVRRRRVGDKYHKIKVGLSAALGDPESRWVMFVDADDLVHRDVAAYALEHDGQWPGGHTVTRGYSWRVGEDVLRELNAFHRSCGTCNVVRLADWEKEHYAQTRDVNRFERGTHWLFAGHASVFKRLRDSGRGTDKLPFRAAIYVTDTGFNYSGVTRIGNGQVPLDDDLKTQFGIS